MYPQGELIRLAGIKAGLRQRIARRRAESAQHLGQVTRPLRWVDHLRARWQRLGPLARLAAVPLSLWLTRGIARPLSRLGWLARWAPALFSLARGLIRPRAGG